MLLNIAVNNPSPNPIKGVISCRMPRNGKEVPVEHPFDVASGKQRSFTVPLDRPRTYRYSVRCQLRFLDDGLGTVRDPSSWVEVAVPAARPAGKKSKTADQRALTRAGGDKPIERF